MGLHGAPCAGSIVQVKACPWAIRCQPATTRITVKTTLRCDETTVADTMWALIPDAYLRLVREAGWPTKKFQAWLADLLQRLFLA
jgi:hypothetical protein